MSNSGVPAVEAGMQRCDRHVHCEQRGASSESFPSNGKDVSNSLGDGTDDTGDEGSNDDGSGASDILNELKGLSASQIKDRLVDTLELMINDESQLQRVEQSILRLEEFKATPITPEFTELALAGTWDLRFSSLRTRVTSSIRIRRIMQRFDTTGKQLVNQVLWSFPSKSNTRYIDAVLTVQCSYVFVGPGRLDVSLQKHAVNINDSNRGDDGGKQEPIKDDLPDDMQAVVNQLRLALPIEYFDPSGLSDVSYIEPNFRICRFLGKRLAGVRNVFTRST